MSTEYSALRKAMRKLTAPLIALAVLLAPHSTFAVTLMNPLAFDTLQEFLTALLGLVIQIGFPVIVLFIIYIGFRFVQHSATGNAEELKKDREYILWAIVGALILLGAQALSIAIQATVNSLSS